MRYSPPKEVSPSNTKPAEVVIETPFNFDLGINGSTNTSTTTSIDQLILSIQPLTVNLNIKEPGIFAPVMSVDSDPSALDDHKIKDVYLLLNYRVVS